MPPVAEAPALAALARGPVALAVLDAAGAVTWSSRQFDVLAGTADDWGDEVQAALCDLASGAAAVGDVTLPGHRAEMLCLRGRPLDGGGAAVVVDVVADPLWERVEAAEAALHDLARSRPGLLALLERAAADVGRALGAEAVVALVGGAAEGEVVRCAVWPPDAAPGLVAVALPDARGAQDVTAPPVLDALGSDHALVLAVEGEAPAALVVGRGRPWRPADRAAADRLATLVSTLWGWAAAEDRFERTVADLDDALFTVAHDADGRRRYTFVTPQAEALTALDPDALLAGDADWADLVVEADREAFATHDGRLRAGRPSAVDVRARVGGDVVVLRERATPSVDAGGRAVAGGLLADVTAEREAAAQVERARRVAERAAHTRMAFLRTMSHELRTPLGVIRGFAELLGHEVEGLAAPPEVAEFAETIQDAADRALRLVSDLLDLSRLETEALDLRQAPVALGPLLAAVADRYRPALDARGVALHVEPTAATVTGDPARVEQVVDQLLSNAAKFTERGAVSVSVADGGGGAVRVEVADTGVGMSDDVLDAVFEPFVQGDARVNRRFEGSGLGLTIARRLAEQMGGGLAATGAEGEGSTFTLTLPSA